jgi:hypothetical protein
MRRLALLAYYFSRPLLHYRYLEKTLLPNCLIPLLQSKRKIFEKFLRCLQHKKTIIWRIGKLAQLKIYQLRFDRIFKKGTIHFWNMSASVYLMKKEKELKSRLINFKYQHQKGWWIENFKTAGKNLLLQILTN